MDEQAHDVAPTDQAEKLTDWKNPPTIRSLKQDLQDAKPSHDTQVSKINDWLDNLKVEGKAKVNTPKANSKIVPKLIRKQAEWRYSALSEPFLSTEDLFNVSPVTWEDKKGAEQNQLVLNHQFNTQINKVDFIDEYVRTAVDEGTVIVRLGWDFEEKEVETQVPEVKFIPDPALAPMHEKLHQMMMENPTGYQHEVPLELQQAHEVTMAQGIPVRPEVTGYTTVIELKTVRNRPTVEVCDYRNVIVDPTCKGDLTKAGFIIYHFESSLSTLEKEGKYRNLHLINTETNSILGEPDHATEDTSDFNFSDTPRKKFVVYEYWGYWDIDGTGVVKPIVAAWVGDVLIRLEENPFPDQAIPFIKVQYLPVRRNVYGEPDGHLLEDNQKVSGAVTRGMIDLLAKSANGQTGIRKDALDLTNRRKYEKGLDYEFNAHIHPDQAFYMHKFPEIPVSAQFMLQLQNQEAEALTGVKAFTGGLSGEALGKTATGVRGVLDAASKREMGILRRLADGVVQIGRKVISMNAEFLDEEEVVRITNSKFVTVRRDDLPGNYDLKLSISTAEEDNAKAQELAFMLQTMGNSMDFSMTKMILTDIAKLRKMPELAKRIEEFEPQPDPLQQENLMLQNQLLKAQIANELSQSRENDAEARLDLAKARTEIAKASNLQSDSDLKNLDFVEQESGVKQERDLQKQGAQARANMTLEGIKHQFKLREKNSSEKLKKAG
jgi:hypothetical protein